jgi:zinc and cadmium transporter
MLTSTLYTVLATIVISLTGFIGFFTLSLSEKILHRVLFVLVAFSAGTILGAALFDLLPEAVELVDEALVFPIVAAGFVFFLFLERVIYWYHGHGHEYEHGEEKVTMGFAYLNLIGDFIHNFIDGMIIAAGFINGFIVGLTATIAVLFHELPQEMGDYGILVYAGMERRRALALNFLAAVSVIIGGAFGSLFIASVEELSGWMVAFSAGAFLFLSASELIPEMLKEDDRGRSVIQLAILVLGMLTIYSLGWVFPHE